MNKLVVLLITIFAIASCNTEVKDYVSISGHLDGLEAKDTLLKFNSRKYSKSIKIDAEGNFKDTLRIKEADFYSISIGVRGLLSTFLTKGNDLTMNGDVKNLNNTMVFEGNGAETNNYLITRGKEVKAFTETFSTLYALDTLNFNKKLNDFENHMADLLKNKAIDTAVVKRELQGLEGFIKGTKSRYQKQHAFQNSFTKGTVSPKFVDYENYNGGKTSLDDLQGKYVYIDVWATWCRPCLAQIPALKELEEAYHDKNIEFVSISTDKPDKHEAWINMIKAKEMSGIQLYAGKDQSFMQEYQISSIPRFIFIDPSGNIVNADAPRPSDKEGIKKMFDEAGL